MRGITSGSTSVARVADRAKTKASQIGAGPMTQSARAFRTVPDTSRRERLRIQPRFPNGKDFGTELLRAKGAALMGIASKVESTRTFNYAQIQSDPSKWAGFVKNINAELRNPESPFCKMSGEEALALLMTLEEAGHACEADLPGREFAELVLNLPQLAQLTFTAQDKLQIGALARSVVDAAADIMPANGMDFINMAPDDRKLLLRGLMDKSLACLEGAGLGLAESDQAALRAIDFSSEVTGLFSGGFTVIPGYQLDDEAEGSLMLSPSLLLPSAELTGILENIASHTSQSTGDVANQLIVNLISTVAHELYHASQYSQISGPDINEHSEFFRAQANQFSLAVERQHNLYPQPAGKKFVLFHHEQGAWYTTHMIRAAIAGSPRMDKGLQDAAEVMAIEPRDFAMLEVLVGNKPPAVAIVEHGQVSSAENVGTPQDVMRATPTLGRDELNKVAPVRQEGHAAQSGAKV